MALDGERAPARAEHGDLAGRVRLHPDRRLRAAGVAQQRPEDETWHRRETLACSRPAPGVSEARMQPQTVNNRASARYPNAVKLEGQRTLRARAHDILRAELLAGRLTPGQRVNEVQVAAEIGISRGTLREAIRKLEQEGMFISIPHRGTFVRKFTPQEAEELQEVRLSLETTAALRVARSWSPPVKAYLEAAAAEPPRRLRGAAALRRSRRGRPGLPRGDLRVERQPRAARALALADGQHHRAAAERGGATNDSPAGPARPRGAARLDPVARRREDQVGVRARVRRRSPCGRERRGGGRAVAHGTSTVDS